MKRRQGPLHSVRHRINERGHARAQKSVPASTEEPTEMCPAPWACVQEIAKSSSVSTVSGRLRDMRTCMRMNRVRAPGQE